VKKLNLAVFISGRGSNLQALIEACSQADFPARISLVLSNRPDAAGLLKATQACLANEIVDHTQYPDREAFEQALLERLAGYDVDLICLAGFMRILTPYFLKPWEGKIINIHPSLLPAYKGLNTHERILQDGQRQTGCTVHYVTPDMDSGPVIVQRRVQVRDGDTPEILALRVLEQEHIAYPEAVRKIAEGKADGR
jgi:phosphoribosylglycinamide formyltransferase 1